MAKKAAKKPTGAPTTRAPKQQTPAQLRRQMAKQLKEEQEADSQLATTAQGLVTNLCTAMRRLEQGSSAVGAAGMPDDPDDLDAAIRSRRAVSTQDGALAAVSRAQRALTGYFTSLVERAPPESFWREQLENPEAHPPGH